MSDNESLEPFFNDTVSDINGLKRDLRFYNPLSPLDGYHISDQEVGNTSYFGYLNKDGAWYVQKAVRTSAVTNYTYKAGASGYDWSARASGTYASFDTTF